MQILLHKNLRLAKIIFALLLAILFLASCKSKRAATKTETNSIKSNEINDALAEKYAVQLQADKKELTNYYLLKFIDEWCGVPYKYGGKDKSGIDCSAFTATMLNNVFGKTVGGSAQNIFNQCSKIETGSIKEGDLVFFKIENKNISHVGVYIMNNKFIHATTKKGVMINDLGENYYKKYFFSAGRIN